MEITRISSCYEKYKYERGDQFICRVTHVYDLSKFWIVTKPKELDRFQILLCQEYFKRRDMLRMPEDKIVFGMYCVVLSEGTFYRTKIVGVAHTHKAGLSSSRRQVQTFFLDFGMTGVTTCDRIYTLTAAFAEAPTFAVRAALAGVCPVESHIWSNSVINRFNEIHSWVEMEAVVVNSYNKESLVEINCRRREPRGVLIYDILLGERLAQPFVKRKKPVEVSKKLAETWGGRSFLKYPYLFPTHEILEEGKVPCYREILDSIHPNMPSKSSCKYYRCTRGSSSVATSLCCTTNMLA